VQQRDRDVIAHAGILLHEPRKFFRNVYGFVTILADRIDDRIREVTSRFMIGAFPSAVSLMVRGRRNSAPAAQPA
jgi:hypothetical protein